MNDNKSDLKFMLRPEDCILVLIDPRPSQFAKLNSHEPTMIWGRGLPEHAARSCSK